MEPSPDFDTYHVSAASEQQEIDHIFEQTSTGRTQLSALSQTCHFGLIVSLIKVKDFANYFPLGATSEYAHCTSNVIMSHHI